MKTNIRTNSKQKSSILPESGQKRVIIEQVHPQVDNGMFPIKRVVGERVTVTADIFSDGHDKISAVLLYRQKRQKQWNALTMESLGNDRWRGIFFLDELTDYEYTVEGWIDHFRTLQDALTKKYNAGQDISLDIQVGTQYIADAATRAQLKDKKELLRINGQIKNAKGNDEAYELLLGQRISEFMYTYPDKSAVVRYDKELPVYVQREKALFSTWYELFPRSCSAEQGKHGTLKDVIAHLPEISRMGFDVLYLPPIHPIGRTNRKGKNNNVNCVEGEPGSPWAIGSSTGGHNAIESSLGTYADLKKLINAAKEYEIEIALDIAFQCSPDHPYVKKHPEWFKKRPDGSIQYAENPPKKYEDIVPFDFESAEWEQLWNELKEVVLFWAHKGVRIFRIDNPHTKPFVFWQWLIKEVKKQYPETLFLAEAFTRPHVMYRLAKIGFDQSYTYFTWRNTKHELIEYITELTKTEVRNYFRPNFWPNTPDILPEFLQYSGRPGFIVRYVLAATLSSNCGIYGPAFELCCGAALSGREEYADAEKYEIKNWNRNAEWRLNEIIARVNEIRKENPALQSTYNISFYRIDNDNLLVYGKCTHDGSNCIIVAVNLDPFHTQSGWLQIPIGELGIHPMQSYLVHDLLSNDRYIWKGEWNYIELNPQTVPVHILRVHKQLKRESDFDYYL